MHVHDAVAGAVVCAEMLSHHGYAGVYDWEHSALRRVAEWLQDRDVDDPRLGWWCTGDDTFIPWLLDNAYGTTFPTTRNTNVGKNIDFTGWTHP